MAQRGELYKDCGSVVRSTDYIQIAWGFTQKSATRIQIINESIGLVFDCTESQVISGECVAQTGEQL
jgi:hypothetical protein